MITLGISLGHDSGISIIENNEILFAINEERLSRIKGQSGFPSFSLQYVNENFNFKINNIAIDGYKVTPHENDKAYRFEDTAGFLQNFAQSLNLSKYFLASRRGVLLTQSIYTLFDFPKKLNTKNLILSKLRNFVVPETKFFRVDHHLAHAYSIASPGEIEGKSGLILTLDGIGEGLCSRVIEFRQGLTRELSWSPALGSPALMYGYATKILGYKINRHEGKLTGLAAYGDGDETSLIFSKFFGIDSEIKMFKARDIGYGVPAIKKLEKLLKNFSAQDIAAGVQKVFETNILEYLKIFISDKKYETIYLSGGAFANVKLNQRIAQLDNVWDLVVAPNMGDGGLSLGAAQYVHPIKSNLNSLYLGPTIKSINESAEKSFGIEKINIGSEGLPFKCAEILNDKKIIAVARNRMEWGPRALGNRSILLTADDQDVNSWLNKKLKRTEFMPFAPICRDIDANRYFYLDLNVDRYKYMTITCEVTDFCKQKAPAICHIDSTARPQIITKSDNKFMYDLLTELSILNNNPILINTSFNMHEEPIVCDEIHAIKSFKNSELDFLILNDDIYKNI
jgi:carbamoyltransferase